MAKSSSIGVLVSGGLDSDVLMADLARTHRAVTPLYIRQGLAWEAVEIFWLRRFLRRLSNARVRPLHILELPMQDVYQTHWSLGRRPVPGARSRDAAVYLPGRNLILTVKAAVFCALRRIPALALGSLDHNPFADATPAFFKRWSKALSRGLNSSIAIRAPYRKLSKVQVIRKGSHLPLELSFSCMAPKNRRHCGRCNKCAERQRAFCQAGVEDRTNYAYGR